MENKSNISIEEPIIIDEDLKKSIRTINHMIQNISNLLTYRVSKYHSQEIQNEYRKELYHENKGSYQLILSEKMKESEYEQKIHFIGLKIKKDLQTLNYLKHHHRLIPTVLSEVDNIVNTPIYSNEDAQKHIEKLSNIESQLRNHTL